MGVGLTDLFLWERTGHLSLVGCAPFSCLRCWPADLAPSRGSDLNLVPVLPPLQPCWYPSSPGPPPPWAGSSCPIEEIWAMARVHLHEHPGVRPLLMLAAEWVPGCVEEADVVWCSPRPPGSGAALGAQVCGNKANCFWAKHSVADVVFKILC